MGSGAGTEKIAVQRGELATREMDVMAALINRQYVEHKAWFRCPAPTRVDAGIRSAAAGPLEVSVARYRGFEYYGQTSGPEDYLALVVLSGEAVFIREREQLRGLAARSTRIESIAPLSQSAGARWSRAAAFICGQLLDDEDPAISLILAHEMTRMAAAMVLEVFPSA